jgi:hypothetical protein
MNARTITPSPTRTEPVAPPTQFSPDIHRKEAPTQRDTGDVEKATPKRQPREATKGIS